MADKPCILYIEDDTNSRTLVMRVLSLDFDVMTAPNGLDGLSMLQRRIPDLVLTDLDLPDLSGEIIAARIRSMSDRKIPIVALTAQTDRQFRHRAIAAGCIGYLTKPIDVGSLASTVREFLGGRTEQIDEVDHKRATQEIQADLTERLEKTLRKLQEDNAELRNLERAKTAFLTQVAHELRTPLTVLSGYIQMLRQQLHDEQIISDTHRELADMSVQGLKRLHNLMNEIVVMARLASNQLDVFRSPMRLDDAASAATNEYQETFLDRKILFEKRGTGWSELLLGDSMLLRMALSNLISNAIKFTPNGGRITMTAEREGSMVHIIVEDSGIGIDTETMPLLFKPFFTAIDVNRGRTSKTQFMGMGMGMGLTVVTKVVEAHKGQIWAESPGYDEKAFPGSKFHMVLPLLEAQPEATGQE